MKKKIFATTLGLLFSINATAQDTTDMSEQMGLVNLSYGQYVELEGHITVYRSLATTDGVDVKLLRRTEKTILDLADKLFPKGKQITVAGNCALKPTLSVNPLILACTTSPLSVTFYFSSEDDSMHTNFKKSYLETAAYTPVEISSQLFRARIAPGDPSGSPDRFEGKFVIRSFQAGYAKALMSQKNLKSKGGIFLDPKGRLMIPIQLTEGTFIQE